MGLCALQVDWIESERPEALQRDDATRGEALQRDTEFKNAVRSFNSAGVILYNSRGYWLGFERRNGQRFWTDYGGKRQGTESAWETAMRECQEEAGVDVSKCLLKRAPDFHCESKSKHVLFWVETDMRPVGGHHPNFLDHSQFMKWPELELCPRLQFDKGGRIRQTRQELGFERYGY